MAEAHVTPLKAIRRYCVQCMGDQVLEVVRCSSPQCRLSPYRVGKKPSAEERAAILLQELSPSTAQVRAQCLWPSEPILSTLKAIRARCYDCAGWSAAEVRTCNHKACPLHRFRFGKNPNYSQATREKLRERAKSHQFRS